MDLHTEFKHLEVKEVGGVTVIRVLVRALSTQTTILNLNDELLPLLDRKDMRNVLLDLASVEAISSLMLSKLISLKKRINSMGGKLVLCSLQRSVYEVFAVMKLTTLFDIKSDDAEGWSSF